MAASAVDKLISSCTVGLDTTVSQRHECGDVCQGPRERASAAGAAAGPVGLLCAVPHGAAADRPGSQRHPQAHPGMRSMKNVAYCAVTLDPSYSYRLSLMSAEVVRAGNVVVYGMLLAIQI